MPPRKGSKAAAKAAAAPPPLEDCVIALSGNFPSKTQTSIENDFIKPLGAIMSKTITQSTTHLITTETDFAKPSAKVKQARAMVIPVLSFDWLEECLAQSTKLLEAPYSLGSAVPAVVPANGNGTSVAGSRKRAASVTSDDSQTAPQPKKKAVSKKAAAASQKAPDLKMTIQSKIKAGDAEMNVAKSKDILIQLDEICPLTHYRVYIDDANLIYDASLNQTNSGANNNKFYRIQLLYDANNDYKVWTRWGRVGDRGQSAILGSGSLADALYQYEKKFKDKSGLTWSNRNDTAKPNKYTFIERSYADDSDNEEGPAVKKEDKEEAKIPESTMEPAVQALMQLIFNKQNFEAAMADLNYDVQKLPLGKLSNNTITKGYQALKNLSELMDDPSLAVSTYDLKYAEATEHLSNTFYSLIPHAFGRNRPPIINSQDMLKREVELLDSLSDMKDASNIMKKQPQDEEAINALDRQFKGLGMEEMTPLEKGSDEFEHLKTYLVDTKGSTHNIKYKVSEIFRIERQGETERFTKTKHGVGRDTRLLWHGSRATNFGGILSQGLRIAPPEAPVNGYMFGKGIYLADMSSKSANYCCANTSNGTALLLLCEAELGDPMHKLTDASYSAAEDSKANGMISTWGQGMTGPSKWKDASCVHPSLKNVKMPDTTVKPGNTKVPNAYLQYNEYITYDIAQVRLRYLFRVVM